jgi:uncharacterized membrane protein YkoI
VKNFGKLLYGGLFALVVAGLLWWPVAFGTVNEPAKERDQPVALLDKKDAGTSSAPLDQPAVAKLPAPGPVAVDADKAPRQRRDKPAWQANHPVSMAEAVQIAEKLCKGLATRAERKDRPELTYKVDVTSWDNKSYQVEVAADGTVMRSEVLTKGKGKKQ